jgi:hypothetical protein
MIAHELVTTPNKDPLTDGQACMLLLAVVSRDPSDATPAWKHVVADGGFATASRVSVAAIRNQFGRQKQFDREGSVKSVRNEGNHSLLAPAKALVDAPEALGFERISRRLRQDGNSRRKSFL